MSTATTTRHCGCRILRLRWHPEGRVSMALLQALLQQGLATVQLVPSSWIPVDTFGVAAARH
eukprot:14942687-Heterocapsa_arctica.AAC.1